MWNVRIKEEEEEEEEDESVAGPFIYIYNEACNYNNNHSTRLTVVFPSVNICNIIHSAAAGPWFLALVSQLHTVV